MARGKHGRNQTLKESTHYFTKNHEEVIEEKESILCQKMDLSPTMSVIKFDKRVAGFSGHGFSSSCEVRSRDMLISAHSFTFLTNHLTWRSWKTCRKQSQGKSQKIPP